MPLKIIKTNGAVPRPKKHLLKMEVIAGLEWQMKKGDRVEDSQRRGSTLIFKQFINTFSIVKQMSALLPFSCCAFKLHLKGQSRKHFASNEEVA